MVHTIIMNNSLTVSLASALSTSDLWDATHEALSQGRWSQGRAYLDALGTRGDVTDQLLPADQYARLAALDTASKPWMAFRSVIQDRIDQINWRIEHRAEGY